MLRPEHYTWKTSNLAQSVVMVLLMPSRRKKLLGAAVAALFPGLLRVADLIGQLADINYLRKTVALFNELRETGIGNRLACENAADPRAKYPNFFWQMVQPYIVDGLRYLRVTQD
jgi:hypothetical protein